MRSCSRIPTLLAVLASVILLAPGCDPKGAAGAIGGSSRADDKDGVKGELARPRPARARPDSAVTPTMPPTIDPLHDPQLDPAVPRKPAEAVDPGDVPMPTP